jgi:hypothetical protein
MSWPATVRNLVLGETWVLPLSVLGVVAAALLTRELTPAIGESAGGPLLLVAVITALAVSVRR